MASRREPPDSLDFFPTPPWATRALVECVLGPWHGRALGTVWEPACGEGHMAEVLAAYASHVFATDVFPYGYTDTEIDFLGDFGAPATKIDWIITNPPFNTALDFALKALNIAEDGVALLCRNSWIEGERRYEKLFERYPPTIIAPFAERVPMVKGRWDPDASTATAYSWFVWMVAETRARIQPMVVWIPPGQKRALSTPADIERFAVKSETPLFSDASAAPAHEGGPA